MTQLLTSVNLFWWVCGLISHKIFITVSCSFCKLHFHEEYVLVENKLSPFVSIYIVVTYFIECFYLLFWQVKLFISLLSSWGWSTTEVPCVKSGRMWPLWVTRRTRTHCGWHIQSEVQMEEKTPPFPFTMRWWDTTLCWGPITTSTWWNTRSSALTWTPKSSCCLKVCVNIYLLDLLEDSEDKRKTKTPSCCVSIQAWVVVGFLVLEWSTICWPIQWKISSTPQRQASHSACSAISRTSSSGSTAMKGSTRRGSMLLFLTYGERNI